MKTLMHLYANSYIYIYTFNRNHAHTHTHSDANIYILYKMLCLCFTETSITEYWVWINELESMHGNDNQKIIIETKTVSSKRIKVGNALRRC